MSRTITMMPVAHILQNVNRSLDVDMYDGFDWFKVLANKVSHAHFDALTDTILDEGFTLPIVLVGNDDEGYCVGNGHHRLCVAILTGVTAIPVIVNEDESYWEFEDSHDGEWNPGDRSFEYWEMLQENIPDGYYGDGDNEVHRAQFANRPTGNNDDYICDCGCQDAACDDCGYIVCRCNDDCDYCGVADNGNVPYEDHRMGCPEREYELVFCPACGYSHYRYNACDWVLNAIADEAIVEHKARGFEYIPAGVWHPEYILADAYGQHDEWLKDEPLRAALNRWHDLIAELRDAVTNGASEYLVNSYAARISEAWTAYLDL